MSIDELISKGEKLEKSIYYTPPPEGVIRFFRKYDSNCINEYQDWISSVRMFIRRHDKDEYNEIKNAFEEIRPENHKIILGSLRAIKNFPKELSKDITIEKEKNFPVVNVYQNQQTNVSITLINEAFRSELNDNQRKEIQTIIDDKELEPKKKKSKIVETLKKFGGDIASNILANILTNPSFFGF